jgi:phospholipid/cholesterol/gamma-HCH transport system substrate-binding protein
MRRKGASEVKVGLLLLVALTVLAIGIGLIGKESNLFRHKNRYFIRFETVGGLTTGNPVQLNGVNVGDVQRVILPQDPADSEIQVWITLDRRYSERVREDSQARIKTLGLLGDKYVEISSGSPKFAVIPDGGQIATAPATSVDELLASGEDVMDNVTAITFSLRNILERTERGEGVLGELTSESETGRRVTDSILATLESFRLLVDNLNRGDGALPRLLHDPALGDSLEGSLTRLDDILTQIESGDGLLPTLLHDPEAKARFDQTVERLDGTLANLETLTRDLNEGDGLLQKLIRDEAWAEEVSGNLSQLIERLDELSRRLTSGDGTAARLLNDPQIYDSLNDILIGIDESWMLRWLIRNRQKAGIESRYEDAAEEGEDKGKDKENQKDQKAGRPPVEHPRP